MLGSTEDELATPITILPNPPLMAVFSFEEERAVALGMAGLLSLNCAILILCLHRSNVVQRPNYHNTQKKELLL